MQALRDGLEMPVGYADVKRFYAVLRLYTDAGQRDFSALMTKIREAYPEIDFESFQ